MAGTNVNRLGFGAKERCMPETERNSDTESSENKYLQTTIGDLRKVYGVDFAKGCSDGEKITDVIRKEPSLMRVIRQHERKWFEQI
jgi:hypothetical protein